MNNSLLPTSSSLTLCKDLATPGGTSKWDRNNFFPTLCIRSVLFSTGNLRKRKQVGLGCFPGDTLCTLTAAPNPCRSPNSYLWAPMLAFGHAGVPPFSACGLNTLCPAQPSPSVPWHWRCSPVAVELLESPAWVLLQCRHTQTEPRASYGGEYRCAGSAQSVMGYDSPTAHADLGPASMGCVHIVPKSFPVKSRKYKH